MPDPTTPDAPGAGAELDALIAEKVMGWTRDVDEDGDFFGYLGKGAPWGIDMDDWHPSTDIAAAMQVDAEMESRDYHSSHNRGSSGRWRVVFARSDIRGEAVAPTLPLGICRAALKALAAEGEE